MFLADYHLHSSCSFDGECSAADIISAAKTLSLTEVAITDHCDIASPYSKRYDPFSARSMFLEVQAQAAQTGGVTALYGIELGDALCDPDEAAAYLNLALGFDYILASIHRLRHKEDFYFLRPSCPADCYSLLTQYTAELLEMASTLEFDVLAHLSYPLRYMRPLFPEVSLDQFEPIIRELFKMLAQSGKGLELNTSGLRSALGETLPTLKWLKIFREEGGEIVTVGSDAHRKSDIGANILDGYALLREAGFKSVASFRNRQAAFVSIVN